MKMIVCFFLSIAGESPPGYAARAGMGIGITFIILLVGMEIIYFKYFYRVSQERRDY